MYQEWEYGVSLVTHRDSETGRRSENTSTVSRWEYHLHTLQLSRNTEMGVEGRNNWLMIKKREGFEKTVGCTKTTDLRNLCIFYIWSQMWERGTTLENWEMTYSDGHVGRLGEGEEASAYLLFHGPGTAKRMSACAAPYELLFKIMYPLLN